MQHFNRFSCWCASLFLLAVVGGCAQTSSVVDLSEQTQVASSDNLDVTVDYLFSEEQFAMSEIEEKVSGGLSRWISAEKQIFESSDWQPDPLLQSLPAEVKPLLEDLNSDNFKTGDAHYLQGQIWLKKLAETIASQPAVRNFWPPLAKQVSELAVQNGVADAFPKALRAVHPELNEEQARALADACKLFDWTVRNVVLLERANWPSAQDVDEKYLDEVDTKWPPSSGVAGPGYQRFNWQLLMYGRGDDVERGRVFAQLARQRNIDVALLAFSKQSPSACPSDKLTIWTPAALIGEHLFLFDTRLGLPIPGTSAGRIATLAEVKHDPKLLKSLDLAVEESTSDDSKYWVDAETVASPIVALIDAPLESLSKRMAVLERNLTGNKRISCAMRPSQLAEQLKANPQIQEVRLLPAELFAHQFRNAVSAGVKQSRFNADIRERLGWYYNDEEYIDSYVRLRTAKNKYFLNKFESPRGIKDKGALESFSTMIVVYTDEFIDNLQDNTNVLYALGLQKEGVPVLEYQERLAAVKAHMRLVRGDATYLLGLCHLENGNPSAAATWFDRVGDMDTRGQWKLQVPYLKARTREMLDMNDEAIALYQFGKNDEKLAPATHGNLVRARLVKMYLTAGEAKSVANRSSEQ